MWVAFVGGPLDFQYRQVREPIPVIVFTKGDLDNFLIRKPRLRECLEVKEARALTGRECYKVDNTIEKPELTSYYRNMVGNPKEYYYFYTLERNKEVEPSYLNHLMHVLRRKNAEDNTRKDRGR